MAFDDLIDVVQIMVCLAGNVKISISNLGNKYNSQQETSSLTSKTLEQSSKLFQRRRAGYLDPWASRQACKASRDELHSRNGLSQAASAVTSIPRADLGSSSGAPERCEQYAGDLHVHVDGAHRDDRDDVGKVLVLDDED